MSLSLKAGASIEPISLNEAKIHLRVDSSDEDGLISSLITAARLLIEARTESALLTQHWVYFLQASDKFCILPLRPVQRIVSVRVASKFTNDYKTKQQGKRASIRLNNPIMDGEVEFIAGYGRNPSDVPETLRQALLQLTAFWFENRGSANIMGSALPKTVELLLEPYREFRL